MGKLLAKASCVVTVDDAFGVIPRGAIAIEGDTITEVGPYEELSRRGPFDEEVGSLENDLLMPGLISAHHHAPGRTFRGGNSDQMLECWLPFLQGIYRAGFSDREVYLNTAWACIELIRMGCTAAVDHHVGMPTQERLGIPTAVQAYKDSGIRVGFCVGIGDRNRLYYGDDEEVLSQLPTDVQEAASGFRSPPDIDGFFEVWDSFFEDLHEPDGRVRIFMGPTGPRWCSDELLSRIKSAAQRQHTGIQIHLLETAYQRAADPKTGGKSLVAWMDEMGFWGEDVSCAHGVWLTREDIEILKERGTVIVHNPANNLRLSSGIAPIHVMREIGVNLAFGADGCGVNDDNDLLMDLRLGDMLQRLPGALTPRIPPEEWIKMATLGGAQALLQAESLGSISPGKKADFILLDMRRLRYPSISPDVDPLSLLLQRGLGRDVRTMFVGGKAVMRDGTVLTLDEEAIAKEIDQFMGKHYPRLSALRPLFREVEAEIKTLYGEWDLGLPSKARYQYNLH